LSVAAVLGLTPATAVEQRRYCARTWWLSYASLMGLSAAVAALAFLTAPTPLSLALLCLLVMVAVVLVRPELGLWLIAFFAVVGDGAATKWYPFVKGMSDVESILFVGNSATVSPLEVVLVATAVGWILRMAATRRWELRRGSLFGPVMITGFFVVFGLVIGLSRGGNPYIALWETRPLFALVLIYLVGTNLLEGPASFRRVWSALMAGVVVDSIFAIAYFQGMSSIAREQADHLGEHSASLHANTFFVLLAAMGVMSARSTRRLVVMLLATPIVAYAYILGQRRSAFVGLVIGAVMVAGILYRRRRYAFWCIMPLVVMVFAGFIAAFWNTEGAVGFPAQAVKTVVAPGELTDKDRSSDQFRVIENYNIVFTIQAYPLTGVGFGQQYLRPIPNADISFSQWWEYRTHNSVLWIWMQTGVGGFIAMLYLIASAIRYGTRRLMHESVGYDGALLMTSVVYVVMYAVFAYVDIAWDIQSMVFLGIALACIANTRGDSPNEINAVGADTEMVGAIGARGES
jgi:hypothetical protein